MDAERHGDEESEGRVILGSKSATSAKRGRIAGAAGAAKAPVHPGRFPRSREISAPRGKYFSGVRLRGGLRGTYPSDYEDSGYPDRAKHGVCKDRAGGVAIRPHFIGTVGVASPGPITCS